MFEDDRKPAAVQEKEPRDLEKGEGGVLLPPSAAKPSSSRHKQSHKHSHKHKRSHKHSHKHKHHHHNKTSTASRPRNGVTDEEKGAANDHPAGHIASSDIAKKQAKDRKPPSKSLGVAHHMEEPDNESIRKPRDSLAYVPSLMAHFYHHHQAAATHANDEHGKD